MSNNNSFDEKDYPFGKTYIEEDIPLDEDQKNIKPGYNNLPFVEQRTLKYPDRLAEMDKDRNDRKYFKAYDLIIICLSLLIIISVFDYTMLGITRKPDDNISGVIEILKALLYTLSGYLFAERKNNK